MSDHEISKTEKIDPHLQKSGIGGPLNNISSNMADLQKSFGKAIEIASLSTVGGSLSSADKGALRNLRYELAQVSGGGGDAVKGITKTLMAAIDNSIVAGRLAEDLRKNVETLAGHLGVSIPKVTDSAVAFLDAKNKQPDKGTIV